ncbi:MAG: selenocysteine-specific translation elongation factor [Bacteroidales bacterium]
MKHLIIGTAGHVDHGKTALVKALTGIDCDTHKEEKSRGITINLGFSQLELPGGETAGIVDVPGHKDFIKTMVAGAYGIDLVMLVISADSGIMPQTREHMRIIEMLGIRKAVVALTKTDLVDEETLELARLEVLEFLEGTVFENAPVTGVSVITGAGLEGLREALADELEAIRPRDDSGNFRLYIDRLFNVRGIGYVVTGTALSGKLQAGQEVFLLPGSRKKIKVKGLQRHGAEVDRIHAGDRAALNLSGLKAGEFTRGMLLSGEPLRETQMVDASIRVFEKWTAGTWTEVLFYSGTFECLARMHLLDKDRVGPEGSALVQLHLQSPAILLRRDKFILRNSANDLTVGGGTVLDNRPLHHRKRTAGLLEELRLLERSVLEKGGLSGLMAVELKKINRPVTENELAEFMTRPAKDIAEESQKGLPEEVRIYAGREGKLLIHKSPDGRYRKIIVHALEAWHKKYPVFPQGMDTGELAGKMGFAGGTSGRQYTEALLEQLHSEGRVRKEGNTWALKEHRPVIDQKTQDDLQWLEQEIRSCGLEMPALKDLEIIARERNIHGEALKMMLVYLAWEGKIHFRGKEILHAPIIEESRKRLLKALLGRPRGINEKEFRELVGGTKRSVQLLLNLFLEEGIVRKETFYVYVTEKGREQAGD